MKNRLILSTGVVTAALAVGAIAHVPNGGVENTTASDTCASANCSGGTVALPPGGPQSVYPRDNPVGGANPFVPYGTNPFVPYGTWHGQAF